MPPESALVISKTTHSHGRRGPYFNQIHRR
jgi:hypothetical protein